MQHYHKHRKRSIARISIISVVVVVIIALITSLVLQYGSLKVEMKATRSDDGHQIEDGNYQAQINLFDVQQDGELVYRSVRAATIKDGVLYTDFKPSNSVTTHPTLMTLCLYGNEQIASAGRIQTVSGCIAGTRYKPVAVLCTPYHIDAYPRTFFGTLMGKRTIGDRETAPECFVQPSDDQPFEMNLEPLVESGDLTAEQAQTITQRIIMDTPQ